MASSKSATKPPEKPKTMTDPEAVRRAEKLANSSPGEREADAAGWECLARWNVFASVWRDPKTGRCHLVRGWEVIDLGDP